MDILKKLSPVVGSTHVLVKQKPHNTYGSLRSTIGSVFQPGSEYWFKYKMGPEMLHACLRSTERSQKLHSAQVLIKKGCHVKEKL